MRGILPHERTPHPQTVNTDETAKRISELASDQVSAGLTWLARFDHDIFDLVLDAAHNWDDGGDLGAAFAKKRFCSTCCEESGVIIAIGDNRRHYPGDGPPGPYDTGHPATI